MTIEQLRAKCDHIAQPVKRYTDTRVSLECPSCGVVYWSAQRSLVEDGGRRGEPR